MEGLALVVAVLVIFDLVALAWGVDSRHSGRSGGLRGI